MLQVEFLSYHRDGYQIFSGLNFSVPIGTCLFVRGENGSGKTTLLRLLSGFLPMQDGNITLDGTKISHNHDFIAENMEYIGHLNATKKQMTSWENLNFWNSLCGQSSKTNLTEKFNDPMLIKGFKNQLVSFCSAGQARRIALSRLNTCGKKLWLLDEPTTSLDATSVINLSKMVETHCLNGGLAIIATHFELSMPKVKTNSIKIKKLSGKPKTIELDPFLAGEW